MGQPGRCRWLPAKIPSQAPLGNPMLVLAFLWCRRLDYLLIQNNTTTIRTPAQRAWSVAPDAALPVQVRSWADFLSVDPAHGWLGTVSQIIGPLYRDPDGKAGSLFISSCFCDGLDALQTMPCFMPAGEAGHTEVSSKAIYALAT